YPGYQAFLAYREELARAEDLGDYYRIPADNRGLDYNLYFTEGQERVSKENDYNSHNTRRLDTGEMADLLMKLALVRDELGTESK
ncbi:MAG TPA: UDP-glucose 4-epimerase, partial [Candidatus Aminicenantes bacterium]|nr:UDP-glucose 4-epimerase [Candidatus Aminicenantes bacterium]